MHPEQDPDTEFEMVYKCLRLRKSFLIDVGLGIRDAIDLVLAGHVTGRFDIRGSDVTKVEKTYVGTRIEIELMNRLAFDPGLVLDCNIVGVEVDIKTTLGDSWMIPTEAIDQLCLVVKSDDSRSSFSVGLFRARPHLLTKPNKDGKGGISAEGKATIRWFGGEAFALPTNFLLHMDSESRDRVLASRTGQARVTALFTECLDVPIPRSAVATVARQLDPMKRVRDARKWLRLKGIEILSSKYGKQRALELGLRPMQPGYYISTRSPAALNCIEQD